MSEEILPCLFCGGEMMMMEGFGAYWLGCRSAYDMGCRDAYDGGDNCGYTTPCYASPTEAIAAHNRIAAAPDLYEALDALLAVVGRAAHTAHGEDTFTMIDAERSARAALAKARGEAAP